MPFWIVSWSAECFFTYCFLLTFKKLEELLKEGAEKLASMPAGGGAAAAAAPAAGGGGAAAPAKKEPEPEPEESDDDMGMGLFD